ncbi:unnamed protein product [Paramecium pentaurelia]|uniref:Transmembrane protein n=1 Tax=Paramecium pentaurelia TaxID=43138 RepID=A0A8S1XZ73_9CILI|nr:unnamed protein product [Paramecium pentaurelia]
MSLQFFKPLIITVLLKSSIVLASKCEITQLVTGEVFISKIPNTMLIESDTNDYSNLEQFDQSIISQIIKVSYQGEEQIISSLIVDQINVENQIGQLFCKFLKGLNYFITCMNDLNFESEKNYHTNQIDSLILNPSIQIDDICEEFFLNDHSEFLIFCFNSYKFNIYSINFNNTTTLNLSYQINLEEYIQCKRKYAKLNENIYILTFYQCQSWVVFSYYNNKLKIILNKQIALKYVNQMDTQIENIQLCLSKSTLSKQLFLIMEKEYHHYFFNEFYELDFIYSSEKALKWENLLFTQTCNAIYSVTYVEAVNKTIIYKSQSYLEIEGTIITSQFFQDILFVQTHNELQIYFNQFIKQHLQINTSYLIFYDNFNLIQQVDEINKEITFYKFSYAKNILKPTKKYIFLAQTSLYHDSYFVNCTEIKNITVIDEGHTILNFDNKCQNSSQLFIQKNELALPFDYEILLPLQSFDFFNIYDRQPFIQYCPILKRQHLSDHNLMFYTDKNGGFISLQSKNSLQTFLCNGTNKFKINTANYDVSSYQNFVLIINKSERKLKFLDLLKIHEGIIERKVKSEIINIFQFDKLISIITQNPSDFMIINLDSLIEVKLNENTKRLLYKLFQHSLSQSKNFNQNSLLNCSFYVSDESSSLIQFKEYLIIQLNQGNQIKKIDNIQIVYMKTIYVRSLYYFLAVHLNRNNIIEYHYDFDQLSIFNNQTLDDYQIIRPLRYQINNKYFAIACKNDTTNFIFIYTIYISKPFKLIYVIKTNRLQFFFKDYHLFYYDDKDEVMILSLTDFIVQIKNIFPLEKDNSMTKKNFSFYIVPLNKYYSNFEIEFEVRSSNLCYQIYNRNNILQIQLSIPKNVKLNTLDYFDGPIDRLNILNNDNIIINGPILLSDNLLSQQEIGSINITTITLPQFIQHILHKTKGILIKLDEEQQILIPNKLKNKTYQGQVIVINGKLKIWVLIEVINAIISMSILQMNDNVEFFTEIKKIIISDQQNDIFYQDPIKVTGNLILFKRINSQFIIYSINKTEIYFQENDQSLLQILKVRGQNDLYISLSQLHQRFINIFHLLSLQSNKLKEIGQTIISQSTINLELYNYLYFDDNEVNINQLINFLECNLYQEKISLLILQIFTSFSVIAQIQINLQDFSSSYKVLKFIRNSQEQSGLTLAYYSEYVLLLKSSKNSIYIYNLLYERKLYDYIGSFNLINWNFYPLNTTHLFIYTDLGDKLLIGESGYLIQVNEENNQENTFTLIAQNDVSEAGLKVFIEVPQTQQLNINQYTIWILSGLVSALIILYFLRRRFRLKQQWKYNNYKY